MPENQERRAVPRIRLAGRPDVRVRGLREVRLLDLSPTGAQIEHLAVLQLGATCALELPPPGEQATLPAHVVWCAVMGRKRKLGGETHLVARSGLQFPPLTAAQHGALAASLQRCGPQLDLPLTARSGRRAARPARPNPAARSGG